MFVNYNGENKLFSLDSEKNYLTINAFDCFTVNKKRRSRLEEIMEEELDDAWDKTPFGFPKSISVRQGYTFQFNF